MKRLLTVFSTGFFLFCMAIGPSIAAVTERYCPLFKPTFQQTWDIHEKKWIAKDYSNGFLITSLVTYEVGCLIMLLVCGSEINHSDE